MNITFFYITIYYYYIYLYIYQTSYYIFIEITEIKILNCVIKRIFSAL